ncbi:MAG: tetratricopeptide repeat protein [Cyclobacteriaceae bacterium]|jgi:tetratricopeptide (TPR) repeat protein|nr:tetratricopeptide repeat protein [Flammeovirgaceae bacterium]
MRIIFLVLISAFASGQSVIEKAKGLYDAKKYAEATTLLKGVDDDRKEYAEARYWLGRVAYDQREYDDAADYFEEATEANPKSPEYFTWLGDTYGTIAQNANMVRQGMLAPKMKKAWEQAVALDPKAIDPRLSLIQYYLQAPGFMGGSTEKAVEVANQLVKIKPAEGHRQLGNIYARDKKTAEAEKEYQTMMKADPAYMSVLATYYANQQQHDKAFALLDDWLKNNPNDMSMIYLYGRTAAVSGHRLDAGEQNLKKYLAYTPKPNEPSHAGANMRLGNIYEKRGNKAEAKKYYQAALKLQPDMKDAKEGLERVSK